MKKLLFNPFEKYDARALLFTGLLGILLGTAMAYLLDAHYDGALDMHAGSKTTFTLAFVENVLAITLIFFALYIYGYTINKKTRPIDILSTVLIARIPLYLTTLCNLGGYMTKAEEIAAKEGPEALAVMMPDLIPIMIAGLIVLPLAVWFFVLLYNGFKTATNLKTTKQKVLFAVALIIAEIVSFIVFPFIY